MHVNLQLKSNFKIVENVCGTKYITFNGLLIKFILITCLWILV